MVNMLYLTSCDRATIHGISRLKVYKTYKLRHDCIRSLFCVFHLLFSFVYLVHNVSADSAARSLSVAVLGSRYDESVDG